MIYLFWFIVISMFCLLFVAWAAEDETLTEKADRLAVSRMAKESVKRAMNPAPKRAARWCRK